MPPNPKIISGLNRIRAVARKLRESGLESDADQLERACETIVDTTTFELGHLERRLADCKARLNDGEHEERDRQPESETY